MLKKNRVENEVDSVEMINRSNREREMEFLKDGKMFSKNLKIFNLAENLKILEMRIFCSVHFIFDEGRHGCDWKWVWVLLPAAVSVGGIENLILMAGADIFPALSKEKHQSKVPLDFIVWRRKFAQVAGCWELRTSKKKLMNFWCEKSKRLWWEIKTLNGEIAITKFWSLCCLDK